MARLVFDNFCYFLDLYVGSLIIAYLNVVGGSLGIAAGTHVALQNFDFLPFYSSRIPARQLKFLFGTGTFATVLFLFLLAFSIMLLVGLYQNKPTYVKSSAINQCIFLLGMVVLCIEFFVFELFEAAITVLFCVILPGTYFTLVLRSYYYKMIKNTPDDIQPTALEIINNK